MLADKNLWMLRDQRITDHMPSYLAGMQIPLLLID